MKFKIKYIVVFCIIAFVFLFMLLLYFTLKNTSQFVSERQPYKAVINKKLILVEDAIITKNGSLEMENEYPFELQNFEVVDSAIVQNTIIPKGSVLVFTKAIQVNRAVSGSKYTYMLGTYVHSVTKAIKPILYHWGTFKTICIDNPCNYWEHKKAPWQTKIDSTKYFD